MKKFFQENQGVASLLIALALFYFNSAILQFLSPRSLDPGLLAGSYISAILFGVVIFFVGVWAAWRAYENDFWPLDTHYDKLQDFFNDLNPRDKFLCALLPYFFHLIWFWLALSAAIKLL
jgi:hypothetical protein